MKELLEGRRLGFALRPAFGNVALGVGISATLLDLMAWFAWGARDTNGFVIGAYWLVIGTAIVAAAALLTGLAELFDVPDEDRRLARLDLAALGVAIVLYAVSAFLRAGDLGAAGATPAALLLAVAGLLLLLVDAGIAGNLYSAREWEELDEEELHDRRRRRAAAR